MTMDREKSALEMTMDREKSELNFINMIHINN
jgi:hypothetical protein